MPLVAAPIIVSGPGRCGSTWMQHFLTSHPDCFIHGQLGDRFALDGAFNFLDMITAAGIQAETSNAELAYDVPHYCGSPPDRTATLFRDFFRRYVIGHGEPACFGKSRWGVKWIGAACNPSERKRLNSLWPDCLWVVCLRDPFVAGESLANTFAPPIVETVREYVMGWCCAVDFLDERSPRVVGFLIDRIAAQPPGLRKMALGSVLSHLRLPPSEEADAFVDAWPIIHKATPDADRRFKLTAADRARLLEDVPGLADHATRLGYLDQCPSV